MLINNENIDEQLLPKNLENFSFLREKALAYIQQTATDTWTDHNIHDPGITIMEALCYALTDVGFRLNFPMQDLLADENGKLPENAYYEPQDILPCHAVTINDFRKILMDLPLVKNAWITPILSENKDIVLDYEKMYVYKEDSNLLLKHEVFKLPVTAADQATILKNNSVFIIGLYAINIEFETQPILGNIDSGEMFESIFQKDIFGDIYYDISNWNELINQKDILQTIAKTYANNPKDVTLTFEVPLRNKYNNRDNELYYRTLNEWYFTIYVYCNNEYVFTFKDVLFVPYIEKQKGILGNDLIKILTDADFSFFKTCFEKIVALAQAYTDVQKVLHQNRNLCEDYLPQISAIPTVDFRICADIDVENQVDIEQVQAALFYAIEQYISPTVKFYTYNQMLEKGKDIEEILEGPKLKHGFICEEEMGENSFQDFTINLSDIINAIYEIEGFINCRNIQLFLMDENGNNIITPNSWEIKVPAGYKPILNKRKSKFIFYKNELALSPNFRESIIKLSFLNAANFKDINSDIQQTSLNATHRDLAIHYALANEFPATYKIGKNFPDDYLDNPKYFTSKQLEGYLLLFDQLIANFLTDLDQFKHTLSWNPIQHIQHTSTDNTWRRDYLLSNKNVDTIWQNVMESEKSFLKKRNESLDFLLSRFAENLHELDHYFYLASDNLHINENDYYNYLINLKQEFLKNYISISANRGAAIDIYNNTSYSTAPLSGYENRLSHLLGCNLMKNNVRKTTADITIENDPKNKDERGYFHVLEHILLRIPVLNDVIIQKLEAQNIHVELLSICADDDCTACGGFDPYSFTASVVLPAWINVYADVHYRDYIEKLIRKETPTPVLLRVCWLDEDCMDSYEKNIENWWKAKHALYQSDSLTYNDKVVDLIIAQNAFISAIKKQRSVYFKATLHDCKDEDDENNTRIFLDNTFLSS